MNVGGLGRGIQTEYQWRWRGERSNFNQRLKLFLAIIDANKTYIS